MSKITPELVTQTVEERGKIYGDPYDSHVNIGKTWTALIQQHYGQTLPHDIPASLVAQMMSAFKIQRSARVFHEDNYIDLSAYSGFACDFQKREQKNPKKG